MNKDKIEGGLKQAKGAAKEGIGKLTDSKETEAEGVVEKVAGKVQRAVGEVKDAVKKATK